MFVIGSNKTIYNFLIEDAAVKLNPQQREHQPQMLAASYQTVKMIYMNYNKSQINHHLSLTMELKQMLHE